MKFKFTLFFVLFFSATVIFAQKNKIELVSSNEKETIIKLKVNSFNFKDVTTPNGIEKVLIADNSTAILQKAYPDLPKFTESIIIPDFGKTKVEIVSSNYYEIENISIAPSKGSFTRNINPATVPYEYGKVYQEDKFFPAQIAKTNSPYIARDFRGQSIQIYPFSYNAVKKNLRVYTDITIKITSIKGKGINEFNRTKSFTKIAKEFKNIYSRHFINYDSQTRYTPLEEEGNMLVICYDDWTDQMQPLVDWKNKIGRHCEMVTVTEAGGTANAIKTYVQNYYNTNGLTYLLLVGDASQVPTLSSNGDSDNAYAYVTGNDHYLEFFVGRFSAETAAHVTTQVQRTITYENGSTLTSGWLNKTMGVASALGDGQGDDGEADYVHVRNMQTDFTNFTYVTPTVEQFDGSQGGNDATGDPTGATVSAELNTGIGNALYCGHGSDFSWVSSGFDVSDINNLTNDNKLPFIFDVACVNGNFVGQTCFGEAWLRAENAGQPTGAIAIVASTINQDWAQPMVAEDEMVDILVESYANNIKRTFTGVAVNGMFLMNDETSDWAMTDTWTTFGDPSVMLRTDDPANMNITHASAIIMGQSSFTINCDFDGALACLSKGGVIIGTATVTGGTADVAVADIAPGDIVDLAVTGFNKVTYLSTVNVVAPSGPYVAMTTYDFNGSSTIDYNSSKNLNVELTNLGPDEASDVTATITSNDEFISLSNNENIAFGNIAGNNGTATSNSFKVTTTTNVPDQHVATLHIVITNTAKDTWEKDFTITINAPVLEGNLDGINDPTDDLAFSSSPVTLVDVDAQYTYNVEITTLGGNDNGLLDPGENANISFSAENIGHASIYNSYGRLISTSTYVTINNSETYIDTLEVGESFISDFNIEIEASTPIGTAIPFQFIFGTPQYKDTLNINLPVGLQIEDFETGDFTAYNWVQGGNANWVTETTEVHEGTYSIQSSDITDNQTVELSYTCNVTADGQISFYKKVSCESDYDFLKFYIDGTQQEEWSGEVSWAEHTYNVTAGSHTFKWAYEKDNSEDEGDDCAWIDFITFPGHSSAKGNRAITISGTTLPTWATLLDYGDGTAVISGTTPSSNTNEPVVLEASNGTSTVTQEFSIRVGVTSISTLNNLVKFYPNPTTDILNITIKNNVNSTITILDINGKVVLTQEIIGQNAQINLTNFAKGLYILNMNVDGQNLQNKIMIK